MLRRPRAFSFLLIVFLFTSGAHAQSVYDTADRLDLLPTPRAITLTGTDYSLAGWQIVVPRDAAWARIGAAELNDRIAALEGRPLPVVSTPHPDKPALFIGRWRDPHIRSLAMELDVTLTPADPGEQGYVIAFGRRAGQPVALLGGSDTQGALYACVTFRHLIQKQQDQVVAREASVRDGPDFKIRNNGRISLDALRETNATLGNLEPLKEAAEALKKQIDYYFRHKVNYLRADSFFPSSDGNGRLYRERYRLAKEVLKYAQARGIKIRYPGGVEVGEYLSPERRQEAVERDAGTSYMWAALDAHRRHAEDYADYMVEGAGVFSLHPYDGGGYLNPENWSERSPDTRAMYGENRALADVEQFLMYFNVIREAHPGIALEAVVYPYHYQLAREDFPQNYKELSLWMPSKGGWYGNLEDAEQARRVQQRLIDYSNYLDEHLPEGTYIVFREGSRRTFEALTELYEDHPITIWIYPGRNRGWRGTFTPQVRYAKTWYDPARRDYFYLADDMTRSADGRAIRLAQQEYAWNVDRPDASRKFHNKNRFYERGGKNVTAFQEQHLIPRIARILYGQAAAQYESLIAANLSFDYVMNPEDMGQTAWASEYFDDNYKYLDDQADAMQRVHEALATLVEEEEEADLKTYSRVGGGSTAAWTVYYYRYTGLAAARAQLESALTRARKGDDSQAERGARDMLSRLSSLQQQVDRIRSRSDEAWNRIAPGHTFRPPYKADRMERLDTLQPAQYEEAFREFVR